MTGRRASIKVYIEEGELSEGEIAEKDELNSPGGRHFADLRYEVSRQTRVPDRHRHPHESQQTDTWIREKDGAPVPPYRRSHGTPRTKKKNEQRRRARSINKKQDQ